jgi:uncharacterized protein YegP (UPF0339 family)
MDYKMEVYKHDSGELNGKYDVRIWAPNGHLLYSSRQGYENKADAMAPAQNFLQAAKEGRVIITEC